MLPGCGFFVHVRTNKFGIYRLWLLARENTQRAGGPTECDCRQKDSDGLLSIMKIRGRKADWNIFAPHTQSRHKGERSVQGRRKKKSPFSRRCRNSVLSDGSSPLHGRQRRQHETTTPTCGWTNTAQCLGNVFNEHAVRGSCAWNFGWWRITGIRCMTPASGGIFGGGILIFL